MPVVIPTTAARSQRAIGEEMDRLLDDIRDMNGSFAVDPESFDKLLSEKKKRLRELQLEYDAAWDDAHRFDDERD